MVQGKTCLLANRLTPIPSFLFALPKARGKGAPVQSRNIPLETNSPNFLPSFPQVYGPHISLLYSSPRALKQVNSLGHFFNPHDSLQQRLYLAGSSYELVHGIPPVLDYLSDKWVGIVAQESVLQETFLSFLNSRKDVTVWGERSADPALRVPTISFCVSGRGSQELVEAVERETTKFGFRWGSFYSYRLITECLGLDGVDGIVRVSMVHYNTGKCCFPFLLPFESMANNITACNGICG